MVRTTPCRNSHDPARSYHNGSQWVCRDCRLTSSKHHWSRYPDRRRDNRLKSLYGLTLEQYRAMEAKQGGRCAACGEAATLIVEHDHETGAVRALTCQPCNVTIGMSRESVDRLRACADYLERF